MIERIQWNITAREEVFLEMLLNQRKQKSFHQADASTGDSAAVQARNDLSVVAYTPRNINCVYW